MTTKREQILERLAQLTGVDRNAPLRDFTGTFVSLADGSAELVEEYLNGPIYEFTATVSLTLAAEGANRDATMATLLETWIDTLGTAGEQLMAEGLIQDLRVLPPDYEAGDLWGAVSVKGAELPIEIDYWSDRAVG